MPAVLLGLTSASAATYVANKTAVKNGPLLSTVSPQPVKAGQSADLLGVNLVPLGADQATAPQNTAVVIQDTAAGGASTVVAAKSATPTKVTFEMPQVYASKTVSLKVLTTSNVATPPIQVAVS